MEPETLWERIKQGLRESASTAVEKAEYLGKLGRARLDIAKTRHAIHDAFAELGGRVYNQIEQDKDAAITREGDVQDLIQKIEGMEALLQQQEDSLQALKEGDGGET